MSAAVKRLEETGNALRDALAHQDWTAISVLDLQCRQVVDASVAASGEDAPAIREGLQELVGLYRELVTTCQTEQQRIADELRQLNQSRQGAQVYKLFG